MRHQKGSRLHDKKERKENNISGSRRIMVARQGSTLTIGITLAPGQVVWVLY